MKSRLFLFFCALVSGCMMGPNYKPPEIHISGEWENLQEGDVVQTEDPPEKWWEIFHDPLLTKYIELASTCNNEVLMAEARILEARAFRKVEASKLFPQLSADLNASRTYFSKNGPIVSGPSLTGGTSLLTGLPFQVQIPQTQNLYNALVDASWEIDLFGKVRRGVEAVDALIESTIEKRNDTLLSIYGEVAMNYVELRSNQHIGILIQENIELLEKKAEIVKERLKYGYSNQIELENIEALLASERAALPDIHAQIYRSIYALSILVGNPPEALAEELIPLQLMPNIPEKIAVGLRSDLLRRRPDIRSAERQLAQATANIGVAIASFFPSITLIGDIGLQSLRLTNLFEAHSKTWSFGGDFNLPIFQGGRLMGNLRASEAKTTAAMYFYQQTILNALEEAESALISYKEDLNAAKNLHIVVEKYQKITWLSKERFEKGLVNFIDILDNKRNLNLAQQDLLLKDTTSLLDLISLYKSLGGGF